MTPLPLNQLARARLNLTERTRILEVVSNIPLSQSADFIVAVLNAPDLLPQERLAAAEGLFKLSPRIQVPEETLRGVTERLRTDALSHREAELRLKSARALAYPGQNNRDFLRQLLQTETDPEIRRFLTLASQEYPTE